MRKLFYLMLLVIASNTFAANECRDLSNKTDFALKMEVARSAGVMKAICGVRDVADSTRFLISVAGDSLPFTSLVSTLFSGSEEPSFKDLEETSYMALGGITTSVLAEISRPFYHAIDWLVDGETSEYNFLSTFKGHYFATRVAVADIKTEREDPQIHCNIKTKEYICATLEMSKRAMLAQNTSMDSREVSSKSLELPTAKDAELLDSKVTRD